MDPGVSRDAETPPTETSPQYPRHAFLIQRAGSLTSDAPAHIDASTSSKQKRRRTSPQDHALLEAAYQKNSKPDKNERAEIVSSVALGEKEVQIWFQNRRQNDRRKSRPLLPHELVPHLRSVIGNSAVDDDSRIYHLTSDVTESQMRRSPGYVHVEVTQSTQSNVGVQEVVNAQLISEVQSSSASEDDNQSTPPSSYEQAKTKESTPPSVKAGEGELTSSGKKRTHSEMSARAEFQVGRAPKLDFRSSIVRLSMTADGAMKVKTTLEDTPSPEKAPQARNSAREAGLQRSKSAIEGGLFSSQSRLKTPIIGSGFGRSRDARTWEFYADSDARDSLSMHAETERSGSAVGAIALIRSQSQKSKAQPLSSSQSRKTNAKMDNARSASSKPKLSRAKSSMARLEGYDDNPKPSKSNRPTLHKRSSSGDSDKENWAPGTCLSANPLRRTQPSNTNRIVLQDQDEHFHGRCEASASNVQNKGEELDCVQGLLSLSQGAWR